MKKPIFYILLALLPSGLIGMEENNRALLPNGLQVTEENKTLIVHLAIDEKRPIAYGLTCQDKVKAMVPVTRLSSIITDPTGKPIGKDSMWYWPNTIPLSDIQKNSGHIKSTLHISTLEYPNHHGISFTVDYGVPVKKEGDCIVMAPTEGYIGGCIGDHRYIPVEIIMTDNPQSNKPFKVVLEQKMAEFTEKPTVDFSEWISDRKAALEYTEEKQAIEYHKGTKTTEPVLTHGTCGFPNKRKLRDWDKSVALENGSVYKAVQSRQIFGPNPGVKRRKLQHSENNTSDQSTQSSTTTTTTSTTQ